MTNTYVVKKLIGSIQPSGSSHIDFQRFENLKEMCNLVKELIVEIDYVAHNKDRQELTMKEMGEYAHNFLTNTIGITEQINIE